MVLKKRGAQAAAPKGALARVSDGVERYYPLAATLVSP